MKACHPYVFVVEDLVINRNTFAIESVQDRNPKKKNLPPPPLRSQEEPQSNPNFGECMLVTWMSMCN